MGAYYQLLTPGIPELGGWVYMGPLRSRGVLVRVHRRLTNATPTDAYRGAGRPEATFVVERLVDAFARRVGMDPAEVRRKNLHAPFAEATPSIMGLSVDSADYEPALDRALELADYSGFRKEQQARRDARRHDADRYRRHDLHRDVRARAVEHPRGAPLRRGRLGRRRDRVPSVRQGGRPYRHVAARPGSRDRVGADRRRRARRDARGRRGAARRHQRVARSAWTPTDRGRSRSAARRCTSRSTRCAPKHA